MTFRAVYRSEKRGGTLADLPGDIFFVELSGSSVLPTYRSRFSARVILRAIIACFCNV